MVVMFLWNAHAAIINIIYITMHIFVESIYLVFQMSNYHNINLQSYCCYGDMEVATQKDVNSVNLV